MTTPGEPRHDEPARDPALDAAWRGHMREEPSARLDDAILAAAHRAAGSPPVRAVRTQASGARPARSHAWAPLAAAATLAVVAFGIAQMAPRDDDAALTDQATRAPAARTIAPGTTAAKTDAPTTPVAPPAPEPEAPAAEAPALEAPAAEAPAPDRTAPLPQRPQTERSPPASAAHATPSLAPPTMKARQAPRPSAFPAAPDAPVAPDAPAAPSVLAMPAPPPDNAPARAQADAASEAHTGSLDAAARSAPSSAPSSAPERKRAQAGSANASQAREPLRERAMVPSPRTADDYVQAILRLRAEGRDERAADVLRQFREAYDDADAQLPQALRAWARGVPRP